MKTKIIVDAMGGDNAPDSVVRGAIAGAKKHDVDIILVGDKSIIETILKKEDLTGLDVQIEHAASAVLMSDPPSVVQKEKLDSSIVIGCNMLASGKGDVLISAGNTGALFMAATLYVRRHKGVRRAALGAIVPLDNTFIIVDSGANTDATPELLLQFAKMGSLYCENLLGVKSPRIGLLNNGSEPNKGTDLYKQSYELLKESDLNFVGNCEGRDLPNDFCDVVVCDGFTGNILLKTIEGMGKFMSRSIKKMFHKSFFTMMGALFAKAGLDTLSKSLDHKEHGGAPFLGIAKPVIKIHGAAEEKSVIAAIKQAKNYHQTGLNDKIGKSV